MLDLRDEHAHAARTREGQIVRFGPPAREDDLGGCSPREGCDRLARILDPLARALAEAVHRGGIAGLSRDRRHRCLHLGAKRGRGVVIEVNLAAHPVLFA